MISSIHADKVCENDEFEYNIGEIVKHKIDFRNERGDAYAYYTVVTFKDGTKKTEVMSKFEVEQIKERSSAWASFKKYGKICPWNTDYDEMAKKTVFKRASKWLPLSAEAKQAIDIDNDNETDFPTYTVDNRTPEQMYAPVEDDGIIDAQCAVVEEKAVSASSAIACSSQKPVFSTTICVLPSLTFILKNLHSTGALRPRNYNHKL